MKLKNIDNYRLGTLEDTNIKLNNLHKEIWNEKPNIVKLKNYKINDYESSFSINIDDTYWLTIKKVDGKIVFDAKHEWFIDEEYSELNDNEIIDNWNIDMINRYLKAQNKTLITNEKDIIKLEELFKKLE